MPRTLRKRRTKRKKYKPMLKAPRRPLPDKLKRCLATHRCKVPYHIRSARQPIETEVRVHVAAEVSWERAVGIFGKYLQNHNRFNDKRVRFGERVWVGSVLAVFNEGPEIRELIQRKGIKQSCYYQRENPRGDHFLLMKLSDSSVRVPGLWEQNPDPAEVLSMIPDIISPKDIDYFIGPKHVRRIYRLQNCSSHNGAGVYPLLYAKGKRGRVLLPGSEEDTAEVVAVYKTFVRDNHLLGRTVSVSREELECLESQIPKKLHLLPPEAIHHLIALGKDLAESVRSSVEELRMAVGWY